MFFKISFVLGWCWSSWTFNKEGFQQKNIERSSRHFCWALNPHDVRFFATNGQMDTVSPQSWDCLLSLHRKCKDPQTPLNTSTRIYPLNRSMENQQSVHIITVPFKSFNRDLPGKKNNQLWRFTGSSLLSILEATKRNLGDEAHGETRRRPDFSLFHPSDHRVLVSEG